MNDIFKKLEKNCENYYKIAFFLATGCSSVATGAREGLHRRADGEMRGGLSNSARGMVQ